MKFRRVTNVVDNIYDIFSGESLEEMSFGDLPQIMGSCDSMVAMARLGTEQGLDEAEGNVRRGCGLASTLELVINPPGLIGTDGFWVKIGPKVRFFMV